MLLRYGAICLQIIAMLKKKERLLKKKTQEEYIAHGATFIYLNYTLF